MYFPRLLEKTIQRVKATFPAVVITGPRQSGKSTLLGNLFPKDNARVLALENPDLRALLRENPLAYLRTLSHPVILDEVQEFPEILNYVKILVDENRKAGQWFITGSQQFSVMKNVSESLAGRAAVLALPPFQLQERPEVHGLEDFLFSSTYPELVANKKVDTQVWYSSYLQTYLERDVRKLINVQDLRDFELLIRLLASRTAQELHYSILSRQLGMSVPTIKRWISVLEASYIIFLLPPYYKNFGKRIVKAPKLYFYDIGLVNYLVGINHVNQAIHGPMAGALFETAVVSEITKRQYAQGVKPELYYWRSQSGLEVDVIIPKDGNYIPYEIKLSSTIKPLFYHGLREWLKLSEQKGQSGYLITDCSENLPLPAHIKNIYWKNL